MVLVANATKCTTNNCMDEVASQLSVWRLVIDRLLTFV